jgi:hypothetical protein
VAITKVLACDARGCHEHIKTGQAGSGWFLVVERNTDDNLRSVIVETFGEWEEYTSLIKEPHRFACCFVCLTTILSEAFSD